MPKGVFMAVINQITQEISVILPKLMRYASTNQFSKVNVTPAQIIMLASIHDHGRCKIKTLAKERRISPPTATGLIDRLVKGKYVKRDSDPEDRRVVMVSLTEKGENTVRNYLKAIKNVWKNILTCLTVEEQRQYLNILKKIVGTLSEAKG